MSLSQNNPEYQRNRKSPILKPMLNRKSLKKASLLLLLAVLVSACKSNKTDVTQTYLMKPVGPQFVADSALAYCQAQCDFGPRIMNSDAHDRCGQWIADKFKEFGCKVLMQKATLTGYDGTPLRSTNIMAQFKPDAPVRILLCAHWDSRPWADNDPDSTNWRKPVMAANDGASGVAVMLEVARLLQQSDSLQVGVDFLCFDAEDWGVPQWSDASDTGDSWALGAQYWSKNREPEGYSARFGILLDMVGGQGARFYRERMSMKYAASVVDKVWTAAETVGYASMFPREDGANVTDDHLPVNQNAGIPTIDIIPCYFDCPQSSFGPTWHTVFDDMDHIAPQTLQAVGQTLIQVIFSEQP